MTAVFKNQIDDAKVFDELAKINDNRLKYGLLQFSVAKSIATLECDVENFQRKFSTFFDVCWGRKDPNRFDSIWDYSQQTTCVSGESARRHFRRSRCLPASIPVGLAESPILEQGLLWICNCQMTRIPVVMKFGKKKTARGGIRRENVDVALGNSHSE